ncbi:hypothetical protein N8482_03350, partial [Chitinophagales bacterium]|nr:hypothetical protein [Chitinophagales bacterium]
FDGARLLPQKGKKESAKLRFSSGSSSALSCLNKRQSTPLQPYLSLLRGTFFFVLFSFGEYFFLSEEKRRRH